MQPRIAGGLRGAAAALLLAVVAAGGCQSTSMQLRNQGLRLYHQGRYRQALAKFNAALCRHAEGRVTDPRANYYAGSADYRLQRYEQAAYHYKLVCEEDPKFPHIASATADAYIKAGKPNTAIDFLERYASLVGTVHARELVGRFYQRIGDLDNAAANFQQATRIRPADPYPWLRLGRFYDSIHRRHAAGLAYARAYRLNPLIPGLPEKMQHDGVGLSQALAAPSAGGQKRRGFSTQ